MYKVILLYIKKFFKEKINVTKDEVSVTEENNMLPS